MREIKFRAWNKREEYMEPVDELQMFRTAQDSNDLSIGIPSKDCWLGKDDVELMQYTGLKDKNGKEIYEGDIIEWTTLSGKKYRFSVEYSNEYAQYIITNTGDVENEAEPLGDYENIEIIGNIYENPELLED